LKTKLMLCECKVEFNSFIVEDEIYAL